MKKIARKIMSFALSGIIVAGSANAAFAMVMPGENDALDYTAYVYNNMTINGSSTAVVVGGNAIVENKVTGLNWNNVWVTGGRLYPDSAPEYDGGSKYYKEHVDSLGYLARGPYAGYYFGDYPEYDLELKPFPTLTAKGALPQGQTVNITESGQYSTFDVTTSGDTNVTITTTSADQLIEIRTGTLKVAKPLNISGPGKVIFYVDKVSTSGTASINAGGDAQNVLIYLSGTQDSSFNNCGGSFNVYMGGTSTSKKITFNGGNTTTPIIQGNVYSKGKVIIQSREIDGFVYAPNSDISLTGGSAIVKGKLVCNNLTVGNSGQVINGPYYGLMEGVAGKIIKKDLFHVTTSASEGGTITAYNTDVEEGTVINIVATPAAGYQFVKFEGDQPDEDGNIVVYGNITTRAIFEKVVAPVGYVNGILGEYYDSFQTTNETALRVKKIDSQIAFNYGYAAPAGTEAQIEAETFSEKWTGFIKVPTTGDYTFKTLSDDGVTLTINGTELINRWDYVSMEYTIGAPIHLEAGKCYPIVLEHQQMPLYAAVYLFWEGPGVGMGLVPASAFYVTQATYDAYQSPVFVNQLSRTGDGLHKEFFDGAQGLNGTPVFEENGGSVYYEWLDGSPDDSLLGDDFSAVMEGYIEGKFTEAMTLEFIIDDGLRVWVDDQKIIDSWKGNSNEFVEGTFNMVVGQKHKLRIEYNDIGGGATCIMRWKSDSQELQVVPTKYLYTE